MHWKVNIPIYSAIVNSLLQILENMKKLLFLFLPVLAFFMTGCNGNEEPQPSNSPEIDAGDLAVLRKLANDYNVRSVGTGTSGDPLWYGASFVLDPETNKYRVLMLDLECYRGRENPELPEDILNLTALTSFCVMMPNEGEVAIPDYIFDLDVVTFGIRGKSVKKINTDAFARLADTVEILFIVNTGLGNDVLDTALGFENLRVALMNCNEFTGKVPCKLPAKVERYGFDLSYNQFTEYDWNLLEYPYYLSPILTGNPIEGPLPIPGDPKSYKVYEHMTNLQMTPLRKYWEEEYL